MYNNISKLTVFRTLYDIYEGLCMLERYGKYWPDCFPEECPPSEIAFERDMSIFRLCYDSNAPTIYDFICDYQNPHKGKQYQGKKIEHEKLVKAFGISVFNSFEAAFSLFSSFTMRGIFKSIAEGEGKKGFSLDEGNNHFIWWSYANEQPMRHFNKVYSEEREEGGAEDERFL